MPIDAKMSFISQIEKGCADKLTVRDMGSVLEIISDVLEGFDLRECQRTDDGPDDMLECFIDALRIQGRSQKTIERYMYVIGKFQKFTKQPTRRINVHHIRSWLSAEKERGLADSSLEGNRQVLSAYFGWLFRESLIERNPMVNVGTIKVPKKQKKIYSETDLARLNKFCESPRDRAILHFLTSSGCRISEVVGLDRDALDLRNRQCVVHGKGNKDRIVYFDTVTAMTISDYLEERKDDNPALFINRHRQRIKPDGVRFVLKGLAKRAGVEHVHPHRFRRTLATELARKGMPIQEVSRLLGHEKLETTMMYVNTANEDIRNDYRKYA